jgi:hypothetical protein
MLIKFLARMGILEMKRGWFLENADKKKNSGTKKQGS